MNGCYGQDWASYQSPEPDTTGLSFVFVKATEGLGYFNPRYTRQVTHAWNNHLVVGHYHYPHMGNDPVAEVTYFLKMAWIKPGELLCLDWEGYDSNNRDVPMSRQIAYRKAFLAELARRQPNLPVGTYVNKGYLDQDPNGAYGDFLWIAEPNVVPWVSTITRPWLFHQYGAKGVDKDYCNLSASDLKVWAQKKENDVALNRDDAVTIWSYEHGTEPDMHAQLVAANQNSAAALAAVKALSVKQPEIDYTKLAAALIAQLKG